jgi:hypothetical protein
MSNLLRSLRQASRARSLVDRLLEIEPSSVEGHNIQLVDAWVRRDWPDIGRHGRIARDLLVEDRGVCFYQRPEHLGGQLASILRHLRDHDPESWSSRDDHAFELLERRFAEYEDEDEGEDDPGLDPDHDDEDYEDEHEDEDGDDRPPDRE